MQFLSFILTAITTIGMHFSASSQVEFPEDKARWTFTVEQNECEATVIAKVAIVEHWHINSIVLPAGAFGYPTKFQLEKSAAFQTVGAVIEPKPIQRHDEEADEDLSYHEGKIVFKQKIKILSSNDFTLKIKYGFQPCDESHCLVPYEATYSLKVKGCKDGTSVVVPEEGVNDNQNSTDVASVSNDNSKPEKTTKNTEKAVKNGADRIADLSMWEIFFWSFGSGLLALITPCMFPMIPMTVSFFTKRSKDRKTGIKNAFLYGLSIVAIYIVLGSLVTALTKDAGTVYKIASSPTLNIFFFLLLVVFAISFLGAFEIRLPSKWINKADAGADRGGMIGIFFMALVLALVSFSCTGPFVGSLLVVAVEEGGFAPIVGMAGFSTAIALPFALFAMFPSWMNSLPQSGGWLNTVKVVLGLFELAFAFKFLSNADFAMQAHLLEREVFIAIWIAIFAVMALYIFGFIQFPHDTKPQTISVGRGVFGVFIVAFVIYLLPGMWGAPLKLINAFPPPQYYSESPTGIISGSNGSAGGSGEERPDGTHLGPQGLYVFHEFDKAQEYANKVGKPLFVDFTGYTCVNCRRMEEGVWGKPGIIDHLKNDVVIVSLHVDDQAELPKDQQVNVQLAPGKKKRLKTYGDKWLYMELKEFNVTAQPYYVIYGNDGKPLNIGSATYETHSNTVDFKKWLEDGLNAYNKRK